jgi:hypothetical protein
VVTPVKVLDHAKSDGDVNKGRTQYEL